jgi:hypothetical protein
VPGAGGALSVTEHDAPAGTSKETEPLLPPAAIVMNVVYVLVPPQSTEKLNWPPGKSAAEAPEIDLVICSRPQLGTVTWSTPVTTPPFDQTTS